MICVLYCPCSPEYCLASLPVKLHLITTPNQPSQLNTMGAIVSHNALPESIWQPVHDVTVALLPVCRAARACLVYTWDNKQCCENGDLCCLYGCYNISDKGKGKGISFFSFPNPRIKPEKKDLAARWLFNIGTGWTVKNYSFDNAKKVCHEHFEESCFETELQERLGFRIRKHLKPDAVPTIFSFKPTQSHVQQERKERAQKRTKTTVRSITSSCLTWKTFLYLEGTIKCLTKGER